MEGWVDVRVDGETITVPQHGGLPSMPGDGKPALPYDQPIPYKPTSKRTKQARGAGKGGGGGEEKRTDREEP